MLVLVSFDPELEFLTFHRNVPAHCLWVDCDAFICSTVLPTKYILMFTKYIKRVHTGEKEVKEQKRFFISMRFWLQKLH